MNILACGAGDAASIHLLGGPQVGRCCMRGEGPPLPLLFLLKIDTPCLSTENVHEFPPELHR